MAEAVGFEPTNGYPSLVFKTSAFNHSATLPASVERRHFNGKTSDLPNFPRAHARARYIGMW